MDVADILATSPAPSLEVDRSKRRPVANSGDRRILLRRWAIGSFETAIPCRDKLGLVCEQANSSVGQEGRAGRRIAALPRLARTGGANREFHMTTADVLSSKTGPSGEHRGSSSRPVIACRHGSSATSRKKPSPRFQQRRANRQIPCSNRALSQTRSNTRCFG
jgi:hypothetical protein